MIALCYFCILVSNGILSRNFVGSFCRFYSSTKSLNIDLSDEESKRRLFNRLLYRRRQRGFLELDLILGKWVDDHINSMDENGIKSLVDVLDLGIPEAAKVVVPVAHLPANQATSEGTETRAAAAAPISGAPNSSPLNLFPQETISGGDGGGGLGPLDFLTNSQQFQALRSMVQANPQILQPMLQELGKQNPQLLRLIQEHNAEFLQLINEPVEGFEEFLRHLLLGFV